jgi:hypothetical protein
MSGFIRVEKTSSGYIKKVSNKSAFATTIYLTKLVMTMKDYLYEKKHLEISFSATKTATTTTNRHPQQ